MLVRSTDLNISRSSILESMEYIDRPFSLCEIPVVESGSKYKVNLFSLFNICEQGDFDKDSIIEDVCQNNNISESDILGVIPEDKFILSEDFRSFVLSECSSVDKVVAPLSSKDPISVLGELYEREINITLDPTCLLEFAGFHEAANDESEYQELMATSQLSDTIKSKIKDLRSKGMSVKDIKTQFPEHPYFHTHQTYGPLFAHYGENGAKNPELTRRAIKRYNTTSAVMRHMSDSFDKSHNLSEKDFNRNKYKLQHRLGSLGGHVGDKNTGLILDVDNKGQIKGYADVKMSSHEGMRDDQVQERIQKVSKMVDEEKYPKSWLAKKIAWLRSLYRKFMYKYTIVKDTSLMGRIKSIAAFILRVIDKLAKKLQDAVSEEYIIDTIKDPFVIEFNSYLLNEVHDWTPMHGMQADGQDELEKINNMLKKEFESTFSRMRDSKSEEEFNQNKKMVNDMYKTQHSQQIFMKNFGIAQRGQKEIVDFNQAEENRLNTMIRHINSERYPRSFIARMINKFRGLYQNIMAKFHSDQLTPKDLDQNTGRIKLLSFIKHKLKRLAAKILMIIDKLMQKLQNASDTAVDKVKGFFNSNKKES